VVAHVYELLVCEEVVGGIADKGRDQELGSTNTLWRVHLLVRPDLRVQDVPRLPTNAHPVDARKVAAITCLDVHAAAELGVGEGSAHCHATLAAWRHGDKRVVHENTRVVVEQERHAKCHSI